MSQSVAESTAPTEEDLLREIEHLERKARELGEPDDPFDWGMLMFFRILVKDRRKRLHALREQWSRSA